MAEFCVDCWNELNETQEPEQCFVLSREPELCEGCGEWKRTIVAINRFYTIKRLVMSILRRRETD